MILPYEGDISNVQAEMEEPVYKEEVLDKILQELVEEMALLEMS